jgi:hypothetical protein
MIRKPCEDHPDDPPLILEDDDERHIAYTCCIQCDRFLGWVEHKELRQFIYELQTEADRLNEILKRRGLYHDN